MNLERYEASALSRLFSASVIHELGDDSRSPLFARLVSQTRLSKSPPSEVTVGAIFDEAFDILSKSRFRDDYVYRAAITQKILLGRHNLHTATLLNELRAGSCKADVVVLNGTSTAYEIKSERDSLTRLQNQIANYRQVFASVNVVVSKSHLHQVLDTTPETVGVITLSERFQFQTIRKAQNQPELTVPNQVLESLRLDEALTILARLGIEPPDVPNTQVRKELDRLFAGLDPAAVHEQMVSVLKLSRSQAHLDPFINSLPTSLRAASLAAKLSPKARLSIAEAVNTPLYAALSWN